MVYAISQDMQEIYDNPDKWVNHGKNVLRDSCKHIHSSFKKNDENACSSMNYQDWCEECEVYEDSATPIINYLYPLELTDFDEDKILKVVRETNCTVLENQDTGNWFLSLCGGGMDLSQDIGYSYQVLETWIPNDLLRNVCKQPLLSLGSKEYKKLARGIIKQLKMEAVNNKEKAKEWTDSLKNLREQEKVKQN